MPARAPRGLPTGIGATMTRRHSLATASTVTLEAKK